MPGEGRRVLVSVVRLSDGPRVGQGGLWRVRGQKRIWGPVSKSCPSLPRASHPSAPCTDPLAPASSRHRFLGLGPVPGSGVTAHFVMPVPGNKQPGFQAPDAAQLPDDCELTQRPPVSVRGLQVQGITSTPGAHVPAVHTTLRRGLPKLPPGLCPYCQATPEVGPVPTGPATRTVNLVLADTKQGHPPLPTGPGQHRPAGERPGNGAQLSRS